MLDERISWMGGEERENKDGGSVEVKLRAGVSDVISYLLSTEHFSCWKEYPQT